MTVIVEPVFFRVYSLPNGKKPLYEWLSDEQEVELYIEACLEVFREDGDLGGLISALELVLRAHNKHKPHHFLHTIGLHIPYPSSTNVLGDDSLPAIQLDGWPTTAPKETPDHPYSPDQAAPYPQHGSSPSEQEKEMWNNPEATMPGVKYLHPGTLLGANTWGTSMLEKDRTLERQ